MESNGRDTILISCFKYQKVVVYNMMSGLI